MFIRRRFVDVEPGARHPVRDDPGGDLSAPEHIDYLTPDDDQRGFHTQGNPLRR